MNRPIHRNWNILKPDSSKVSLLKKELGISWFLSSLLINRGIESVEDGRRFLFPTYEDLSDPFLLPDMDKAVERIEKAVKNNEKIMIYGDYDCDGTTSVSVLLTALKLKGAENVDFYIPNRFEEGYGINKAAITKIKEQDSDLIITVDCGVTAVAEIEYANFLGMDVIVTDHHLPIEGHIPEAHAIIDPHAKENDCPYKDFAGVGLAFKLASGFLGNKSYLYNLLDIVTLGTIVDVAPLDGENRTITKLGLNKLNDRSKPKRPGIRALCNIAGHRKNHVLTGYDFSFGLGPRVNAAGRMGSAKAIVELLMSDSYDKAEQIAANLDNLNTTRKSLQKRIYEDAVKIIERDNLDKDNAIVVAHDWDESAKGVIGLVASNLMETYSKPAVLLTVKDEKASGSGRSDDKLNLSEALVDCSDVLLTHGGHAAAAGLSLDRNNIQEFRDKLNTYAEKHIDVEKVDPGIDVDYQLNIEDINYDLLKEINLLEPCAKKKNPYPVIYTDGIRLYDGVNYLGQTKEHLKFVVTQKNSDIKGLQWRSGIYKKALEEDDSVFAMVYFPELDTWGGKRELRISVQDWKVSDTEASIKAAKDSARATLMKYQDFFLEEMNCYVAEVYDAYKSIMGTDPSDWSTDDWQTFEEELLFCKDNLPCGLQTKLRGIRNWKENSKSITKS